MPSPDSSIVPGRHPEPASDDSTGDPAERRQIIFFLAGIAIAVAFSARAILLALAR
jgi:hypothetical protein